MTTPGTAPQAPRSDRPVDFLVGETLDNGWRVDRLLPKAPGATGSNFSKSYQVSRERDKKVEVAFLKALDLSSALAAPDPIAKLSSDTRAYEFERDLVHTCRTMDHVVTALDDGVVRFPDSLIPVPYLIFEKATEGDSRAFLAKMAQFDWAWALRSLHQIAIGMSQLHRGGIAHQDLKPSNVMVFDRQEAKVGDLGTASRSDMPGPRDKFLIAGDRTYAAPELLYREVSPDWSVMRRGPDLYQLGSLAVFYVLGAGLTSLLLARLNTQHRPDQWGGSYREALPYVCQAYHGVLETFDGEVPQQFKELTTLVRYLTDPDPLLRGHPKNRANPGNPYALERFVSRFNVLAKTAELGLMGR